MLQYFLLAAEQALLTKLGELANQLKGCHSLIVEAGDTVAPWKTKSKSRAAQDALSKQQAELQAVMADLEGTSLCHVSEADSLAYKLQQKEQVRCGLLLCRCTTGHMPRQYCWLDLFKLGGCIRLHSSA